MVISDFYIMCLLQSKRQIIDDPSLIVTSCSIPVKSKQVLPGESRFAQNLKGIWYSFEPKERIVGDYSAEWFDLEIRNNRCFVVANENSKEKIVEIINQYIEFSPIKYVGVLFRLQGRQSERINGVLKKQQFLKILLQNKIRYNTLYIVKE